MRTGAAAGSWPQTIRRYTFLLIAFVVLLGLASTAYVYALKMRSDRLSRLVNDYHLRSAVLCADLHEELRFLIADIGISRAELDQSERRLILGRPDGRGLASSLDFIRERIDDLNDLQDRYRDPRFRVLTSRLDQHFATIQKAIGEAAPQPPDIRSSTADLTSLVTVVTQLERLHIVVHDDLVRQRDTQRSRDLHIFIGAIALMFLVAYLLFSLWSRAIKGVIERRRRAEQDLQKSEQRFRTLFENQAVGNILFNEDGRIETFNGVAEHMFGYEAPEMFGRDIRLLIDEPDRERFQRYVDGDSGTEQPEAVGVIHEIAGIRKDGKSFPMTLGVGAVNLPDRRMFIGSVSDLSDVKALESQLSQAQKMEAIGQLTGGVAHDFNNLLAVISGNLELLAEKLPSRNALRSHIRTALNATERGITLTRSLLAFARRQPLEPQVVDVNKLVRETMQLMRRTVPESIDIEFVGGVGVWACEVDPGQLQNALLNLVLNARDAMPDGGRLTIETGNARLDDEYAAAQADVTPGQYVMLGVSDTGTGIPPEILDHIFEPFFTTKQTGKGSGLGLSMIYGFARQSRGHVKVYSEVGQGTTVRIYLPRTTASIATPQETVEPDEKTAQGETILVVEDNPDMRSLAVELLQSLHYDVLDADDGDSALRALNDNPQIALLFTDVVLAGGMSGRDLARKALKAHPDLKVMYMSGYTENAIVHHGRLDPGVVLLQKPFRKAALAAKLRAVLEDASRRKARRSKTGSAGD